MNFEGLYSEKVMKHFKNPQNMGEIKDADGVATVGNPICVLPETLIQANSDHAQIRNLKKGDKVLTHDGSYQQIKKTYKRDYSGKIYSIRVHNLGEVAVTPEHHILAAKTAHIRLKFEAVEKGKALIDWHNASQLEKGDVILYPIPKEAKDKRELKIDIPKPKWDFKSKDLPEKIRIDERFLRLAGYYLAEGYTRTERCKGTVGFVFGKHETEYIEDVIFLMGEVFGLHPTKVYNRHNSSSLMFYSARLARFFTKLFGKGAIDKQIPHWMMILPVEKQKALLCGLWRGDGCISQKQKTSKFVTISQKLAYQARVLLLRQRIVSSFLTAPENGMHKKHYSIYVKKDDSLRKLAEIMGVSVRFPLKTYNPHGSWFDDNFYYVPIWKIRPLNYNGPVHNLEVENAASYVSNAATLHNCGDIMRLYIKVEKKKGEDYIKDIRFQTLGCAAAIASSSMLTTMVKGKPLSEAEKITKVAVAEALGGLPSSKIHCSVLAADALKKAIEDYKKKNILQRKT